MATGALRMCGIMAIVTSGNPISDRDRLVAERMTNVMKSRGPDGRGVFVKDHVLLGHRRLAIRDVDNGAQPMVSADGQFAITYNGELYNDAELRAELRQKYGKSFSTSCDTETVLAAFSVWGEDCVEHLRGMFAFVAADFRSGKVVIARDRCGVKPVFFAAVGQSIVAASSIASLLEHHEIPKRPNFRAISHYLSSFRLTLGRETMYERIFQLQPGEQLLFNHGHMRIERYWDLPEEDSRICFEGATETLATTLDDSIRRRQISDRPVGMLLSGGVDSAAIAVSMRDCAGNFSARTAGEEVQDAITTAEHVGCDLRPIAPTPAQFRTAWSELLDSTRLPCSTPSDPVILSLSQSLKREVDVALGGEGADELLCGYAAQHWVGEDFRRQPSRKILRHDAAHSSQETFQSHLKRIYGKATFDSPVELFLASNSLVRSEVKPALLSFDAWRAAEQDAAIRPVYEAAAGDNSDESPSRHLYRLIHRINLEGQLSRLDTATMQASLEARVPFTDHLLCEQMAAVPFRQHICLRPGASPDRTAIELAAEDCLETKRLLRTVARRRLPAAIADRRKQSFPTPVTDWLTGIWAKDVSRRICRSPFARELIRVETLAELVVAPERAGTLLWPVMNLVEWGDRQFAA